MGFAAVAMRCGFWLGWCGEGEDLSAVAVWIVLERMESRRGAAIVFLCSVCGEAMAVAWMTELLHLSGLGVACETRSLANSGGKRGASRAMEMRSKHVATFAFQTSIY